MAITKKQALSIVFTAADEYKANLLGHSLLFICSDRNKAIYALEVTFDSSNFKHLTGFKTSIAPNHFLQLCLDRRLKETDFDFAEDGTTPWKIDVLSRMVKKNLSANMIGIYNRSQPLLFTEKIAGNISACMGFCKTGEKNRYVPNTVLKGDIRSLVHHADRILITYRKKRHEPNYQEIVYAAKKFNWELLTLPDEYADLPLPNLKDPFFSQENQAYLQKSIEALRNGKGTPHDLIETDEG